MLKTVTIESIESNDQPKFVKTQFIKYKRDGVEAGWEMIKGFDSVHIGIFNESTGELLFVKQIRIPVLVNDPDTNGEVIEACAGLVDKDKNIMMIAIEEVEEELGYKITTENIRFIKTVKSSVGTSGVNAHLFYAVVNNSHKVSEGGGLESEDIEVVRVPIDKVMDYIFTNTTDSTTLFLTTYLHNMFK